MTLTDKAEILDIRNRLRFALENSASISLMLEVSKQIKKLDKLVKK